MPIDLACEQSARQRNPGQNAYIPEFRLRKEKLSGSLAEQIEDNLNRGDARILNGLKRFFDLLNADAVVLNLAGFLQVVECSKHLGLVVHLGWRAMHLHEI